MGDTQKTIPKTLPPFNNSNNNSNTSSNINQSSSINNSNSNISEPKSNNVIPKVEPKKDSPASNVSNAPEKDIINSNATSS
jgi:uncharacterized protein YgiM (DUF1202 family)